MYVFLQLIRRQFQSYTSSYRETIFLQYRIDIYPYVFNYPCTYTNKKTASDLTIQLLQFLHHTYNFFCFQLGYTFIVRVNNLLTYNKENIKREISIKGVSFNLVVYFLNTMTLSVQCCQSGFVCFCSKVLSAKKIPQNFKAVIKILYCE